MLNLWEFVAYLYDRMHVLALWARLLHVSTLAIFSANHNDPIDLLLG
jgi:hypothetical protein